MVPYDGIWESPRVDGLEIYYSGEKASHFAYTHFYDFKRRLGFPSSAFCILKVSLNHGLFKYHCKRVYTRNTFTLAYKKLPGNDGSQVTGQDGLRCA